MSDSASLAFLIESRAPAALLFGGAIGLLLWLLTLLRLRGAVLAGVLIAVAFVARGWPAAELLAGVLAGAGVATVLARAPEPSGTAARRPGARDVLGLAGVSTAAMVAAAVLEPRGTWLTVATAALAAGAASWVMLVTTRGAPETALRLEWFPDPAGAQGGVAARAPVLAAFATVLVASAGLWTHLLGPGAPAPVALGALLATGVLALGSGAPLRVVAAAVGGLLGAALSGFLA